MTKILDAICEAKKVKAENFDIPDAVILSQGDGPSEGALIIEKEKSYYLTSNAKDINTTLEKISNSLEKIADALTALDNAGFLIGATGQVVSPPLVVAEISEITSIKGELDTLRENLR